METERGHLGDQFPLTAVIGIVGKENLHTQNYKVKFERLRSARLTCRDQAVKLLNMQRLQVVKDT
jgi:hypothetical protein